MNIAIASAGELYGGAEQFIFDFASSLRQMREHTVRVILFSSGLLQQRLQNEGVSVTVIPTAFKYDWTAVAKVRGFLREHAIEVVHTHGYKANLFCAPAARGCGASVVKTEHGAMEPFGTWFDRLKMRANVALDRSITRRMVHRVVFVSKDMQARGAAAFAPAATTVIYNGIRSINLNGAARPSEFEAGKVHFGIVGRLSPVKGHAYFLEAVSRLSALPILVHIFGEGELSAALRSRCEELGIASIVRFHGFKPDIHRFLGGLDALAMPSLHEGFPYTLLEASDLEVPFLASKVGGIAEVFEDGQDCLLAEPRDVAGLAAGIRRLAEDADLRRRLAASAKAKVRQDFMLDGMTRRYLELFERVRGQAA